MSQPTGGAFSRFTGCPLVSPSRHYQVTRLTITSYRVAHYFDIETQHILDRYSKQMITAKMHRLQPIPFPEAEIIDRLDNTWRDSAKAVFNNWLGKVYQLTNEDRRIPFMDGINPDNPLNL
jgi:homoserine trans-succinylase